MAETSHSEVHLPIPATNSQYLPIFYLHCRTNQHSCADPNNHCEMIFQYFCGDNVRNGITTQYVKHDS